VGGFLYFWGERNERTHTWYGLFRDGMRTQSLDVIQKHWTGSWPEKRAPSVLKVSIAGRAKETNITVGPKELCEARVYCPDTESHENEITWHLREEVYRRIGDYAGNSENHRGPIPLEIVYQDTKVLRFITPCEPGPYRLIVQVADNCGNVGYGNVPFHVGDFRRRV
jgi:hypothetical protein